jgi:aspartyl aminopeptidase
MMKPTPEDISRDLLHFIAKSPSPFHAVRGIRSALVYAKFTELREEDPWTLEPGGHYVVTRNGAALIAFTIPEGEPRDFHIVASHCDSPTFQIKENPEVKDGTYIRLNVEGYGGMNMSTWVDRPLSAAGRVYVRSHGRAVPVLVSLPGTVLVIPSLAIHMNRKVNDGYAWSVQKDLLPLYGTSESKTSFLDLVASAAKVKKEDILGHDLFLFSQVPGTIWGADHEFISSPRLDDLQCAFAAFRGYTLAEKKNHICMYALFNHEEVGSGTNEGAASDFLLSTIHRLADALGYSYNQLMAMLSRGFMISADNAHAMHPAHTDAADPVNRPVLNGGLVLKFSAERRYATDGFSAARFRALCEEASIPLQVFTNHSDKPGGSTLGHISNTRVSIPTVDIGLPQLAMHSSYETAGIKDTGYLIDAVTRFMN